jgi:hypothetical protein
MADRAALEAVDEIVAVQQSRCRDETRPTIALRHRVEIIERPSKPIEHRPEEIAIGAFVFLAMGEQKVTRFAFRQRLLSQASPKSSS